MRLIATILLLAGHSLLNLAATPALAQSEGGNQKLDVPVIEEGGDGQMANCASSKVVGLEPGGDGFLAVRSGPGARYRLIDKLRNGEIVTVFEMRGKWAGVVYRTTGISCSSTVTRPVAYERKGWVHSNWLRHHAG